MKAVPGVRQVQDYAINYDRGIFLCEEREKLNADSGNYESMLTMEQEIDGKKQCLYNLVLATTDDIKALARPMMKKGTVLPRLWKRSWQRH